MVEGRDSSIIVRGIGLIDIVLDASDAKWFDAKSWTFQEVEPFELSNGRPMHRMLVGDVPYEIVESKTGIRLADNFASTDDKFRRGFSSVVTIDGRRYDDYRRAQLVSMNRPFGREIELPHEVWETLQASAKKAGQTVGQFVADRCQP